ncbi:MAG: NusG domain II-containing protein [Spirochaetales bacterium]|nr:NusG domain II-containing protein [Spirochaetales bacterium]
MKIGRMEMAAIVLIFLLSLSTVLLSHGRSGNVRIETDSGVFLYSLSEDRELLFEGPLGTTAVEIRDGRARIVSSPCPNHTCYHGHVESYPDALVCLPNHVSLYGEGKGDVDATSF